MTNKQLVKWRIDRNLTQKAASELMKTPLRTYVGWELGEGRIPGVVEMFIKYYRFPKKNHEAK